MPDIGVLLWVAGAALLPAIGWAIHLSTVAMCTRKDTQRLVDMHLRPDEHGFGTVKTGRQLEENTRAIQALTHYLKWFAEEQTGHKAPPPMEENK